MEKNERDKAALPTTFLGIYATQDEVVCEVAGTYPGISPPVPPMQQRPRPESRSGKVTSCTPHPMVYAEALKSVEGKHAFLQPNPDGSITILNNPRF